MKLSLSIKVEFLAGTEVSNAIKEASELSRKLNISYCCFDFNGVNFSVSQNPDVDKLVKDFNWVNENKTSYKYVIG